MNEIVAACQWRDFIIVFTRNGDIYKIYYDVLTGEIQITRFVELFPL